MLVESQEPLRFALALARVAGLFAFVPLPGVRNLLEPARVALALSVTAALYPVWPVLPQEGVSAGHVAVWVAMEGAFGVAIGLVAGFVAEAILLGAQIIALQAGFSYASTIDPTSQADSGVLQVIASLSAALLFLSFGLDREVLRVLAVSFESQAPATFSANPSWVEPMLRISSLAWRIGLRLALPAVAVLTVADLAMALTGRIHSQLQLLSLAFPVKVLAAVLVLSATLPSFPVVYEYAATEALQAIRAVAGVGR